MVTVDIGNVTSSMYFLPDIPDIEVSTAADKVLIQVVLSDGDATSETPINQYYFTSENGMVLYDVADLAKTFMDRHGLVFCNCSVTATVQDSDIIWDDQEDEVTFKIFYASMVTGQSVDDINDFFLVSSDKKILYKTSPLGESVGFLNVEAENIPNNIKTLKTFAACLLNDGTTKLVTIEENIDLTGIAVYANSLTFSYNSLLLAAKAINQNVKEILSFRMELGNRVVSYVVCSEDTELVNFFSFKNEFGFPETIALPGAIKEINSYTQAVAVSGHSRIKYDATVEQSFQLQSAALPTFMEETVTSLLLAKTVTAWIFRSMKPVIVTDSTWEKANEIGTVNAVKFTYKLTDDRPVRYSGSVTKIFNNVYDNAYG